MTLWRLCNKIVENSLQRNCVWIHLVHVHHSQVCQSRLCQRRPGAMSSLSSRRRRRVRTTDVCRDRLAAGSTPTSPAWLLQTEALELHCFHSSIFLQLRRSSVCSPLSFNIFASCKSWRWSLYLCQCLLANLTESSFFRMRFAFINPQQFLTRRRDCQILKMSQKLVLNKIKRLEITSF